jgi:hypothetical protein
MSSLIATSPRESRQLATRQGAYRAALIEEEAARVAVSCDSALQERIESSLTGLLTASDDGVRDAMQSANIYVDMRMGAIAERGAEDPDFDPDRAAGRMLWNLVRSEVLKARGAVPRPIAKTDANVGDYSARLEALEARDAALGGFIIDDTPLPSAPKPVGRGVDTALALCAVRILAAHPEYLPPTVSVEAIVGALQRAHESTMALALPAKREARQEVRAMLNTARATRAYHERLMREVNEAAEVAKSPASAKAGK